MKKLILLSSLFTALFSIAAEAQNTDLAVEYYWLGDLQTSKKLFEQSASQSPDISYYYLGEIATTNKNVDEARSNYQKGVSANPEAIYSKIGLLKLALKSDTKESTKGLNDIAKKSKKDAKVLVEVARAFYENGMVADGDRVLAEARKNDSKSAWPYILAGDRYLKMGKAGDASGQYDQAIHFDAKNTVAYIKSAQIYANTNSTVAINQLKEALAADPSNLIANKFLAEMYYKYGFYPQAIESYENYFKKGNKSVEDITNYGASFYFTDKYDNAIASLKEGLALEPNDRVLNRLLMYSYAKQGKFTEAQAVGEKLFQLSAINGGDESKYLLDDYLIYANALKENGQQTKAVDLYRKAIELDKTNKKLYEELASALANDNKLAEAGDEIQRYIDNAETKEAADYLQMGIYYYRASSTVAKSADETEKAKLPAYAAKAIAAFSKAIELTPDSYQGYYWRANTNTLLDQDLTKGLANADYQKMIQLLEPNKDANKNRLMEAYRYFAIYYLYQYDANKSADEKAKASDYASKVLSISPDDETTKKIVEYLNQ
ncbi:MAG: hypothetical protein LBR48_03795 [Dysgonamonadaceae bacterium]|jgi:tetratricopeptide (TPR) repeat protein|nr:hypothetical protein [Dysgonamonadaceae bacterium]